MYDFTCDCGNPKCHSYLTIRKGSVWINEKETPGWLHIYACDLEGNDVEFMFTPKTRRAIFWVLFKMLFRR